MSVFTRSWYTYLGRCDGYDFIWDKYWCVIVFLGGLMAVDIAPRNASGAALGVVGIASYIGAGLQDVMSGVLIEGNKTVVNGADVYDFTYINWFWIGAAVLSVLLALLVWNARNEEIE